MYIAELLYEVVTYTHNVYIESLVWLSDGGDPDTRRSLIIAMHLSTDAHAHSSTHASTHKLHGRFKTQLIIKMLKY